MHARRYRNLVPDSPLHRHLEQFLRDTDGRASVVAVCEEVLRLPAASSELAAVVVEALVEDDPRVRLDGSGLVEWVEPPANELWRRCRRFAAIDVESTNGSRDDQRIMEIGVTIVEDGRVVAEWSSLVNPDRRIPYWVQQLTGLNDSAVSAAPRFADIAPRVLELLDDAILVAHHARFDVACVNGEISRWSGRRLTNPYVCTVELSRHLLPGCSNYRLETLSEQLRLTHERPHRAGSDARATAELFCHLLRTVEAPWADYLRPRGPSRLDAGGPAPPAVGPETKPSVFT
jgi:DNA polymerase III epsilon subunit family exonuclease